MNILVINASANKERSTTLKLTKAFLEGMGEGAEFVNTMELNPSPCRACFACWFKTGGKCIQQDATSEVVEKIRQADVVIWSIPLYAYGAPSHCKALMDRTLCLNDPPMYIDEKGVGHHPGYEDGSKATVLISTAALPNVKGNFDGLVFAMKHMYGANTATITCAEASMFGNPRVKDITDAYLVNVKKAGQEYKATGKISEELQKSLDSLLVPAEGYVEATNSFFAGLMKKGEKA